MDKQEKVLGAAANVDESNTNLGTLKVEENLANFKNDDIMLQMTVMPCQEIHKIPYVGVKDCARFHCDSTVIKSPALCDNCGGSGHFAVECPHGGVSHDDAKIPLDRNKKNRVTAVARCRFCSYQSGRHCPPCELYPFFGGMLYDREEFDSMNKFLDLGKIRKATQYLKLHRGRDGVELFVRSLLWEAMAWGRHPSGGPLVGIAEELQMLRDQIINLRRKLKLTPPPPPSSIARPLGLPDNRSSSRNMCRICDEQKRKYCSLRCVFRDYFFGENYGRIEIKALNYYWDLSKVRIVLETLRDRGKRDEIKSTIDSILWQAACWLSFPYGGPLEYYWRLAAPLKREIDQLEDMLTFAVREEEEEHGDVAWQQGDKAWQHSDIALEHSDLEEQSIVPKPTAIAPPGQRRRVSFQITGPRPRR